MFHPCGRWPCCIFSPPGFVIVPRKAGSFEKSSSNASRPPVAAATGGPSPTTTTDRTRSDVFAADPVPVQFQPDRRPSPSSRVYDVRRVFHSAPVPGSSHTSRTCPPCGRTRSLPADSRLDWYSTVTS